MTEHVDALRVAPGVHASRDISASMHVTEPISKYHTRSEFSCGKPQLDEYLHRFARQNDEKNISKTFVAVDDEGKVFGYYSLCSATIEFEEVPENIKKNLPQYPIPAALIARLAVDRALHGQGLGAKLIINALQRIASVSEELAVKVVLVDAMDDEAREFYKHFSFIELPNQAVKLFLPIETVLQVFD